MNRLSTASLEPEAPTIAFNVEDFERFDTEQPSDEELLVVNTPQKRFYFKRRLTNEKTKNVGTSTDVRTNSLVYDEQRMATSMISNGSITCINSLSAARIIMPESHSLGGTNLGFRDTLEDNISLASSYHKAQNSLIIGEMPNIFSDCRHCSNDSRGRRGSSQMINNHIDYIDSTSPSPPPQPVLYSSSLSSPSHNRRSQSQAMPTMTTSRTQSKAFQSDAIVPYLILPLSPNIKRIKIENNHTSKNNHISFNEFSHPSSLNGSPRKQKIMPIEHQKGNETVKAPPKKPVIEENEDDEDEEDDEETLKRNALRIQRQLKKIDEIKMQKYQESLVTCPGVENNNFQSNYSKTNEENGGAVQAKVGEVPILREQWNRKIEFLLAIIGFSVDLGNIWRFPKVVYENGGGRFLVPYFVQLIFCGIPLFYMELVLGQFHQTGFLTLWDKICPLFKGLAFTAMIIDLFMAMFYNTIIAWAVYYLILSFHKEVPWKYCTGKWNTFCCLPTEHSYTHLNFSLNNYDYQTNLDNSVLYKVHSINDEPNKKRLVILNSRMNKLKENATNTNVFQAISEFFNGTGRLEDTLINYSLDASTYYKDLTNDTASINEWLKSYFVIVNNTIVEAPRLSHRQISGLGNFVSDSNKVTELIEREIKAVYANQSVHIILNCAKNLNNPTQEFYTRYLTEMHKSTGIEDLGGLKIEIIACLFFVFLTVYFALWKGIKSAGKAVWITAIAPYIVMFILLIRGLTLEGSSIGLEFYLTVDDWSKLWEVRVWVDAATQIFFSLGPGFGTIIALSSYNKRTNDCFKDALLTSSINCLTSILSGFVVFSTLGHMAHVQGKSIEDVAESGPGLIFITYPQAISMMPVAPLWAVIFFFMLFTLGIDSTFGGLESVITGICDTYPSMAGKRRPYLVLFLIVLCFFLALPTVTNGGPYIVHLFDSFAVAPSILFVVFLEIIGVMYCYGCDRFCDDIYIMLRRKPSRFWIICWKYISPAIVVVMTFMICKNMLEAPLSFGNGYVYEGIGEVIAGFIVGVPISFILIYIIYKVYRTEGLTIKERFVKLLQPAEPWIKNRPFIVSERIMRETKNDSNLIKMENLKTEACQTPVIQTAMSTYDPKTVVINFNHSFKEEPVNL